MYPNKTSKSRSISQVIKTKRDTVYFITIIIVICALLAIGLSNYAFGITVNNSDGVAIKDVQRIGTTDSHRILIEFCKSKANSDFIGVIVTSNMEKIPILLEKNSSEKCQIYVGKIFASDQTSSIKTGLFGQDDIYGLISHFDAKVASLEDKKIKAEQALRIAKTSLPYDEKKIERLEKNIQQYEKLTKSAKSSLVVLSSLRK